jgi:hypothetical protein
LARRRASAGDSHRLDGVLGLGGVMGVVMGSRRGRIRADDRAVGDGAARVDHGIEGHPNFSDTEPGFGLHGANNRDEYGLGRVAQVPFRGRNQGKLFGSFRHIRIHYDKVPRCEHNCVDMFFTLMQDIVGVRPP